MVPQFSHVEQVKTFQDHRIKDDEIKTQQEYQKTVGLQQGSVLLREKLCSTYRAEIEACALNEKNYLTLKAQLDDLRSRRDSYKESIEVLKSDFGL